MSEARSFLGTAKSYARYATDAPIEYTELTALQDLGLALGPDVVCRIQPKAVYHNIYLALVGQSTLARKDTIQEIIGEDIVLDSLKLPKSGSPEGFLEALTDIGGTGIQYMGEWSEELKGIKSGSYMATFAEVKNNLFNCKPYSKKLVYKKDRESELTIPKPYLCIHTTITPEVLKEKLTMEMIVGGYVARFLLATGKQNRRPRGRLNLDTSSMREMLRQQFEWVRNLDKSGCHFEPSDEALRYYNEVVEKECGSPEFAIVSSCAGRCMNYVFAIADLLWLNEAIGTAYYYSNPSTISRLVELVPLVNLVEDIAIYSKTNRTTPTNLTNLTNSALAGDVVLIVQKRHMEEAWRIVRKCLVTVREIAQFVDMGKALARVREYIYKHRPNAVSHSDAMRMTNLDKSEFASAIETLLEREEITEETKQSQNGHSTRMYRWLGDENRVKKPTQATPQQMAQAEEALSTLSGEKGSETKKESQAEEKQQ